jgi:hypothetical protein
MKLGNSMRGRTTKFTLAFHGAPKHDAWRIHERPNTKKCTQPPTFGVESWRLSKDILCLASHGAPKHKAWEFHERLSNKICLGLSWSSQAWCSKDPWGVEHFFLCLAAPWNILNMPSTNFLHSSSNIRPPKICLGPCTSFWTWSLEVPRHARELQERSKQIFLLHLSSYAT